MSIKRSMPQVILQLFCSVRTNNYHQHDFKSSLIVQHSWSPPGPLYFGKCAVIVDALLIQRVNAEPVYPFIVAQG